MKSVNETKNYPSSNFTSTVWLTNNNIPWHCVIMHQVVQFCNVLSYLILSCVTIMKTVHTLCMKSGITLSIFKYAWKVALLFLSIFKIFLLYLAGCILIIPQCNLFQGYDSVNLYCDIFEPAVFQILHFCHHFIWHITFWFVSPFLHMESYAFTMKCLTL